MSTRSSKIVILIAVLIGMCSVPISCITRSSNESVIVEQPSPQPTSTMETEAYTERRASLEETVGDNLNNNEQPTPTGIPIAIVSVNSANIRNGPGTNYDKIGYAVRDGGFVIIGKNESGDWYNIQLNRNEYGWIAASVVETMFAENVNISVTVPPPKIIQQEQPPQPICSCDGDRYNCSSFSRQWQAQSCYNYCIQQSAGDIHGLDSDNDGRVCESLP